MRKREKFNFGERFLNTRWTYLFDDCNTNKNGRRVFVQCDCGVIKSIRLSSIKEGSSCSCGCLSKEVASLNNTKHGMSSNSLYSTYTDMIKRCYNEKRKDYKHYGGRGISVCDRWLGEDGIFNFIEDLKEKPENMELDRIDVNGDYSPENVQWADRSNQSFNRRRTESNVSGRVGVYFHNQSQKWRAEITHRGTRIGLGNHPTFELACKARKEAEIKYFGYHPEI